MAGLLTLVWCYCALSQGLLVWQGVELGVCGTWRWGRGSVEEWGEGLVLVVEGGDQRWLLCGGNEASREVGGEVFVRGEGSCSV